MVSSDLLPTDFSDLFARVSTTRQLTTADRYRMLTAICSEMITDDEIRALDRIFYAVRHGQMQIVDDLSAVF